MSDELDRQNATVTLPPGGPEEQIAAMLDRPDAKEYVGSFDPPVLYRLVMDAGWDAAQELVPYLTPTQLQTCLDLDCWTKNEFQPSKIAPWLAALVAEADDRTFRRACRETDAEMLALFVQTYMLVDFFGEEGEVPEDFFDKQVERSPDGVYALVYIGDDSINALLRSTMNRLFELDMVLGWTLLEAARWELRSGMEEEALRWRTSRLEEWGYVKFDEAMEIYKPLDGQRLRDRLEAADYTPKRPVESETNLPVIAHLTEEGRYYAAAMIRRLEGSESESVMAEFVALQNRASIAEGVDPGDRSDALAVAERTAGYLSIGLEFLARRDDERAIVVLRTVPIRDVFRVGYTTVDRLRDNVQRIRRRPTLTVVDGMRFSLLREADAQLCESIANARPLFADSDGRRDIFHTQSQVDDAAMRLGLIAFKQLWLFGVQQTGPGELVQRLQSGKLLNEAPQASFDAYFASAVLQVLLGEAPDTEGLVSTRLSAAAARVKAADWGDDVVTAFEPLMGPVVEALPAAARLATMWLRSTLSILQDELGAVTDPDPKLFTDLLILRQDGET